MNVLGSDTVDVVQAENGDGVEVVIPERVTEILELAEGDEVDVSVVKEPDGSVTLVGDLVDVELTASQRTELEAVLDGGDDDE